MNTNSRWFLAPLLLCALSLSRAGAATQAPKPPSPLAELLSKLKSGELKKLAEERYGDVLELDMDKAKAAIDLFYDLRAKSVLLRALDNRHYPVKAYAAGLLKDLVEPGDVALAERLVAVAGRLESGVGGSEIFIPRGWYRANLVEVIAKITALDFRGLDPKKDSDLSKILAQARQWVSEDRKKK